MIRIYRLSLEDIKKKVLQLESPGTDIRDFDRAFDTRPILPDDFELTSWMWRENPARLRPRWHVALYGIYSRYLFEVKVRVGGPVGNNCAIIPTGQPLLQPLFWQKHQDLWLDVFPHERLPRGGVPFSLQGYVIEPAGTTII